MCNTLTRADFFGEIFMTNTSKIFEEEILIRTQPSDPWISLKYWVNNSLIIKLFSKVK